LIVASKIVYIVLVVGGDSASTGLGFDFYPD
jgi:hypothetical protein